MSTFPATLPERIHLSGGKGPGSDSIAAISASDVLQMLRRRVVLVTALSLFLCLLFGAGFVVWWYYFPGYRSECLIECVSNIPAAGLTVEQERLRQEEHERFVATQALLLKSPTILGEALKISAVRETDWFKSVQRRKKEHLIELTDVLAASPVRGTNFLRVALEAHKKSDPAVIVDGVVRFWLETVKKRSTDEFAADLQVAQTELEASDRKIEDKRRQLGTIADRIPPGARLSPTSNITSEEGRQLAAQVATLQLERAQLEQFKTLYNDPRGVAATAEDRVAVEQDPQVAELRRAVFLLEQQRAADLTRYGPNHGVVRQLESQLNSAREKLTQLEGQRLSEIQSANREAANTAHANTQHQLYLAEEGMARTEAALADQDRLLFEYANLEGEIGQDMRYRIELSNYVKSLERVVRQRSAINVSIAQPATEPLERNSPSRWLIPVAVFLAFALSTGTALGLELLDKSIRTSQDVTRFLDLPMLGAVPHTDDEEVAIDQVETASRDSAK
ncbi:MAG: hypothetical protein AABZ47_11780, partial [Planctomycetota bacterium]